MLSSTTEDQNHRKVVTYVIYVTKNLIAKIKVIDCHYHFTGGAIHFAFGACPLSRSINTNLFCCKTFKKGLNMGW